MKSRLAACLLLLLMVSDLMACPGCTRQRMMESFWFVTFPALHILCALLFAGYRLDVVRLLYVFIPYSMGLTGAVYTISMYGHPAVRPQFVPDFLIDAAFLATAFDINGALLLYALGCFRFFRRQKDVGLAFYWPIAYVAGCFFLRLIL